MKALFTTLAAAALLAACASVPAPSTKSADGILTGPNGHALYVFSEDKTAGQSACNDTCAANWPPLAVSGSASAQGDYTVINRAGGAKQWAFKGKPLYYFVGDKKPGDKNGHGLGGMWSLAKP